MSQEYSSVKVLILGSRGIAEIIAQKLSLTDEFDVCLIRITKDKSTVQREEFKQLDVSTYEEIRNIRELGKFKLIINCFYEKRGGSLENGIDENVAFLSLIKSIFGMATTIWCQLSSCAVYGLRPRVRVLPHSVLAPVTRYGKTKLAIDEFLLRELGPKEKIIFLRPSHFEKKSGGEIDLVRKLKNIYLKRRMGFGCVPLEEHCLNIVPVESVVEDILKNCEFMLKYSGRKRTKVYIANAIHKTFGSDDPHEFGRPLIYLKIPEFMFSIFFNIIKLIGKDPNFAYMCSGGVTYSNHDTEIDQKYTPDHR